MQLSQDQVKALEKQHYRFVGSHSAVKVCQWTKNMLTGRGGCYKFKFYGIRSHQCLQMTTSMYCANRCMFCWRGEKAPVSKEWYGDIDEPKEIVNQSIASHLKLLLGYKGNSKTPADLYSQSTTVKHVALSLTGEPITYPKINDLLNEFHKRRISTFLVTNAQFPESIQSLNAVTQLYVSVDAPDKPSLKKVDLPLFKDYWARLKDSLKIMSKKKFRTCIRLTLIKNINDNNLEGYKELIELGSPTFIEVKSYMNVGASRNFLKYENMPTHEEVLSFSRELVSLLPDYEIIDDHKASRAVCLIKKLMNKKQFIDFSKFFQNPMAKAIDYSSDKMQPN